MPAEGGTAVEGGDGGADTEDVGIGIEELPVPGAGVDGLDGAELEVTELVVLTDSLVIVPSAALSDLLFEPDVAMKITTITAIAAATDATAM